MIRRNITHEVSVSEMRRMREEEGLTNVEIGERLGCSGQTVYKYIGPMPPEMVREAKRRGGQNRHERKPKPVRLDPLEAIMPKAPAQSEPVEESPVYMLTTNEIITVSSPTRKYTIDRDTETVDVESKEGDGALKLCYEDIDTLIIELRMIRRKMGDSIKVGLVPW